MDPMLQMALRPVVVSVQKCWQTLVQTGVVLKNVVVQTGVGLKKGVVEGGAVDIDNHLTL
jgi:hypothetical protein